MTGRPERFEATGGSDQREARSLDAPLQAFDLTEEAARLRTESQYLDGDRNARTLVKSGSFRLTLVAFKAGAAFDEHDQEGSLAIHVLEGRVEVGVGNGATGLGAGGLAFVAPGNPWAATGREDGLMLLHLAWPPDPGSRS